MKPPTLLLAASLAANAALLALLCFRSAPSDSASATVAPSALADSAPASSAKNDALVAALASGDAAALTAAGVSPEVINQLAAARAFGRLAKLAREQDRPGGGAPAEYWRKVRQAPPPRTTREQRAERAAAEREFEATMRAAFGEDPFGGSGDRMAFLPAATREKLRQIERDYEEMRRDVSQDSDGIQLPADREKWRLLEAEKQRDINAALSPAERDQFELRSSHSAHAIIDRYGDILASEDEYKRLFAIQKAFDDKYSTPDYQMRDHTPEENRARTEAERKLNDDLRAALGDDRWAAIPRENDNEYRSLTALATHLNLPAATPVQIYQLRDAYAGRSLAINQNPALNATERRAQFGELATRAKAELGAILGADGAGAYTRSAGWVNMLQNGTAFTTDARQLPAGSPRPSANATTFAFPPPRPAAPPKP